MGQVLITGGAGFIGARLAEHLAPEFEIVAFDNLHPQVHDGNPANVERLNATGARLVQGDVRDAAALRRALEELRPSIVYHFAAETGTGQSYDMPAHYCEVNVQGTANLIEAVREVGGIDRVVLAGSRSVYGEGACVDANGRSAVAVERLKEDMARGEFVPKDSEGCALTPVATQAGNCQVMPASVYASTKLMQEYLLRQAFWGTSVSVGILRLQNVYGPGQSMNNPYTGVLSIFCRQILEGRSLRIYEDGEITRDFVHVDDVAAAFAAMARVNDIPADIIDIGAGEGLTIETVASELLGLLGAPRDRYEITGDFRPGDIRHAVADIALARDLLGWRPRVSPQQGLKQLALWSEGS